MIVLHFPASSGANGRHFSLQELDIDLVVMARYMQVRTEVYGFRCLLRPQLLHM